MKKHRQAKRVNNDYRMKVVSKQAANNNRQANDQRDFKTSLADKEQ